MFSEFYYFVLNTRKQEIKKLLIDDLNSQLQDNEIYNFAQKKFMRGPKLH